MYYCKDENAHTYHVIASNLIPEEDPYVSTIPQTSEQYCIEAVTLEPLDLDHLVNPNILSPEQQELIGIHNRLDHIPCVRLIKMAEEGEIPHQVCHLRNSPPFCASFAFGKARKRPRITNKSKHYYPIRKLEHNCPGKWVSVDHLHSAQPGIIPQMSGHLTHMGTWKATIFVDYFTNHIYIYFIRDLTMKEKLITKAAFERSVNVHG